MTCGGVAKSIPPTNEDAGAVETTNTPSPTLRCTPFELGFLTPNILVYNVLEPPPSKFSASSAPAYRIKSANSRVRTPREISVRPSQTNIINFFLSLLYPIEVRGCHSMASARSPSVFNTSPFPNILGLPVVRCSTITVSPSNDIGKFTSTSSPSFKL